MDIKQILLVVGADGAHESATSIAAKLAERHGAVVKGVCLFHEPAETVADSFAMGRLGIEAVLEHRDAMVRELTAPAQAAFESIVTARGLSGGWDAEEASESCAALVTRGRLADLIVMSAPGADGLLRVVLYRLLIDAGVPCLLAPPNSGLTATFHHVALAWDGSSGARRAIGEAMVLLKEAEDADIVVIGDEPECGPRGEALARMLLRHGVNARLRHADRQNRHVGQALLDECAAVGADLLVMGAFGHPRAAEAILGGVTRTVLSTASLPVLLSR